MRQTKNQQAHDRFRTWLETEKLMGLIDIKMCIGQQKPNGIDSILDSIVNLAEAHDQGKLWSNECASVAQLVEH